MSLSAISAKFKKIPIVYGRTDDGRSIATIYRNATLNMGSMLLYMLEFFVTPVVLSRSEPTARLQVQLWTNALDKFNRQGLKHNVGTGQCRFNG